MGLPIGRGSGKTDSTRGEIITLSVIIGLLLLLIALLLLRGCPASGLVSFEGSSHAGIVPLLTISGPGTGANPEFDRPLGAAFGQNGDIYVADSGHDRICVFDKEGHFLREFGGKGVAKPGDGGTYSWAPGRLNYPTDVTVSEDGEVFVADLRNDQVVVFDTTGEFVRRFPDPTTIVGKGASGSDGRGIAASAVAVFGTTAWVADTYQIASFDERGDLLSQWGKPGTGSGDLDHPSGLAVTGDSVVVSDSNHARVAAFSKAGKLLWSSEESSSSAGTNGTLALPRGIAPYDDGFLVADAIGQCLVELDRTGQVVGRYGERGVEAGQLNFPTDVDVSGERIVIANKENNRVDVVKLEGRDQ